MGFLWLGEDGRFESAHEAPVSLRSRMMLAHRRLAILDLSPLGHQPMRSVPERQALCYNGEIYNYRNLQDRLQGLADHPLVGEARGMGMIGAVELVADKEQRTPFTANVAAYCQKRCEEGGLILRALGGNAVAMCPPLIITRELIDELFAVLTKALDETLDYARAEGLLA